MGQLRSFASLAGIASALVATLALGATDSAAQSHTSGTFSGPKVNAGTVSHAIENGKHMLTLSDDFVPPDTPDPHWQIVDSKGRTFLLDRIKVKGVTGDRIAKKIAIPPSITDIAKVQIYCAWAEAVLGEASFSMVIKANNP